MAFNKKDTTAQDVFALTLPLRCEPWQQDYLDKMFRCTNHIKNALIGRKLKALRRVEQTLEWRFLKAEIAGTYAKIDGSADPKYQKKLQGELKALFAKRKAMLAAYGLTKSSFERDIKAGCHHYRGLIHSQVAQKIAYSVWDSFEDYLYGSGKEIHFSRWDDLRTLEGKSNTTGFSYRDQKLFVNGKKCCIPVSLNRNDRYGYETEALSRTVHFCKIVRRPGPSGWQYFVQLVLAGKTPVKVKAETGEVLHPLGCGRVGIDIGPQTVAVASDTKAQLAVLAENVQSIENELRRINRAMDRSRRAMNPEMLTAKGEVVTIDKLPESCVRVIRGERRRAWVESKRYKQLKAQRRYLYSKQRVLRTLAHYTLANQLVQLGDEFYIEKMHWQALAKRAKKTEVSEKTGKHKRKKRFGKSIANKAPTLFVNILCQKVVVAGGTFQKVDTTKARASQYDHQSKAYKKKHLSQRWHTLPDGTKVQRDLYSAFLLQHTNDTLDGFIQALLETNFSVFKTLHDQAIESLLTKTMPSSVGLKRPA